MKGFGILIAYMLIMSIVMAPAYIGLRLSGVSVPFYAILGIGISHHLISTFIHATIVTRKKSDINYIDPSSWISN